VLWSRSRKGRKMLAGAGAVVKFFAPAPGYTRGNFTQATVLHKVNSFIKEQKNYPISLFLFLISPCFHALFQEQVAFSNFLVIPRTVKKLSRVMSIQFRYVSDIAL
jgi:hypothetical protein